MKQFTRIKDIYKKQDSNLQATGEDKIIHNYITIKEQDLKRSENEKLYDPKENYL